MAIPNEPVAIQKLYTSRNNNANAETFVGEVQRLWYNPDTNCLYVSDGVTPGGIPLNACGNVNANIRVKDEGVVLTNNVSSFDFIGAGVTATAVGNLVTITIPGTPTSGVTVLDEGNILTQSVESINFVGNTITATATGNAVTVTVTDTTALIVQDEGSNLTTTANTLNFTGAGVTASNVGNVITVNVPGNFLTSYDEGNLLTANTVSYNFVGEGVTATATGNAVTVDVGPGIAYLYSGQFIFDTATTLTLGMNSNTTNPIQVVSTTGFYDSGYIRIGTEIIQYTGRTATTFTGITRGQAGSGGSTHNIGAGVTQAQVTAPGVPEQVLLDLTEISNNVTLDPATGNVTVGGNGTYNIMFSAQVENFSNAPSDTVIWFRRNGNDIPISSSYATTAAIHAGVPGASIIAVNTFSTLTAGDVVALAWTSLNGQTAITSIPPVGNTIPQSPGVIFTINRIY